MVPSSSAPMMVVGTRPAITPRYSPLLILGSPGKSTPKPYCGYFCAFQAAWAGAATATTAANAKAIRRIDFLPIQIRQQALTISHRKDGWARLIAWVSYSEAVSEAIDMWIPPALRDDGRHHINPYAKLTTPSSPGGLLINVKTFSLAMLT